MVDDLLYFHGKDDVTMTQTHRLSTLSLISKLRTLEAKKTNIFIVNTLRNNFKMSDFVMSFTPIKKFKQVTTQRGRGRASDVMRREHFTIFRNRGLRQGKTKLIRKIKNKVFEFDTVISCTVIRNSWEAKI